MERWVFVTVFIGAFLQFSHANEYNCEPISSFSAGYSDPVCYTKICADRIENHIKEELNAAFHYLYMATYFDQDSINRPGLAKFLYESASEEREHAMYMLDYMNGRGMAFNKSFSLTQPEIDVPSILTYKNALETTLNMEIKVTNLIHAIVKACETDFHGADVFTDPILAEQHTGVRKLQGLIKSFNDMMLGTADLSDMALAEFLFDKKMAEGAI